MTTPNFQTLRRLVGEVWHPEWVHRIPGMHIDVARYPELQRAIPDTTIVIDEVYPSEDIVEIAVRFAPFLSPCEAWPFLGTLGGNAICIGNAEVNWGRVYYHDFDFGTYGLDRDLTTFLRGLTQMP